jgi:hypothetical protein
MERFEVKTIPFDERVKSLKAGDYVGFRWDYGFRKGDIIVDNITWIAANGQILVHFLYGYKSESEYVKPQDIILIGDHSADTAIRGWGGKYWAREGALKTEELKDNEG